MTSDQLPQTHRPAVRALHALLLGVVLLHLAVRVLPGALGEPTLGVVWEDGRYALCDFVSHAHFVRAAWAGLAAGGTHSVYAPESHLAVARAWTGAPVDCALPFGYSPTLLWLLGPFAPMPDRVAFLLWLALSGAAVCWLGRPGRMPFAVPLALCSPLAVTCFALGQTAVLSTAALLWLALRSLREQPAGAGWRGAWPDALVLWALTAKPPLALTAGVGLLAARRFRPVALALGLTLLTTLALTPWLGPGWAADYLRLLTRYDSERADPAFAWCLAPSYMCNLRSVLHLYLGVSDHLAAQCGAVLWCLALVGVLVGGLRRALAPDGAWVLALLALLVLSPHVNVTEGLHLLVVAALAQAVRPAAGGAGRLQKLLPPLAVLAVWLSPGAAHAPGWFWPMPAFVAELLLAVVALAWVWESGSPGGRPPRGLRFSALLPHVRLPLALRQRCSPLY
jgi:hypothetical protein